MSSVEIKGIEQIFMKLEGMDNLEGKLKNVAKLVEDDAKQNAPKGDTGNLSDHIYSEVEREGDVLTATIYATEEYAPYQEYGTGLFAENGNGRKTPWAYENDKGELVFTRGNRPHPFMRPALQENRETIIRYLKGGLTK